MLSIRTLCFAVVLACAVGCGANGSGNDAAPVQPGTTTESTALAESPTAESVAETINAAVPEVTSLIAITADNDANNMIGRVNGYVAATVLVDSRITEGCETAKPGIVCGAGIEQWPDEVAAQQRADYIKSLLSSAPILGTEYQTVKGNLLLRVSGKLKPSAADAYEAAFKG
jgi:serine/threonine-protein kinase